MNVREVKKEEKSSVCESCSAGQVEIKSLSQHIKNERSKQKKERLVQVKAYKIILHIAWRCVFRSMEEMFR